jgi:small subunit ribosomal protein S17
MPKRILRGVVVSDTNNKTVVVKVERRFTHPLLKKTVRRTKNYHAHDENNIFKVGQQVSIEESKPISKQKRWRVLDDGQVADASQADKEVRRTKSPKAKPARQ